MASAEIPPYRPLAAAGFDGIDLFGTSQITAAQVVGAHRELFEVLHRERSMTAKQELQREIETMGEFAFVGLSLITYYPPQAGTYLTIDIVDEAGRDQRLRFDDPPAGDVPDPDGVLAAWKRYEEAGRPLIQAGEIDFEAACPAYHCVFNFDHPDLAPYLALFDEAAARHQDELVRVLREDRDFFDRGRAAYVLAHIEDGEKLVELMIPAFRDPSSYVRNSAMRVVALLAKSHPEIAVPLSPVVEALHFPTTTDRNKAAAILSALAENPAHHEVIAEKAGDVLLAMLQLTQPNNHDYAYEILEAISGREFGARDYGAWQSWLVETRGGVAKLGASSTISSIAETDLLFALDLG